MSCLIGIRPNFGHNAAAQCRALHQTCSGACPVWSQAQGGPVVLSLIAFTSRLLCIHPALASFQVRFPIAFRSDLAQIGRSEWGTNRSCALCKTPVLISGKPAGGRKARIFCSSCWRSEGCCSKTRKSSSSSSSSTPAAVQYGVRCPQPFDGDSDSDSDWQRLNHWIRILRHASVSLAAQHAYRNQAQRGANVQEWQESHL